jgi:hypothetical protein
MPLDELDPDDLIDETRFQRNPVHVQQIAGVVGGPIDAQATGRRLVEVMVGRRGEDVQLPTVQPIADQRVSVAYQPGPELNQSRDPSSIFASRWKGDRRSPTALTTDWA